MAHIDQTPEACVWEPRGQKISCFVKFHTLNTESKRIRVKFLQVSGVALLYYEYMQFREVPCFLVSHGLGSVIGLLVRQGQIAIPWQHCPFKQLDDLIPHYWAAQWSSMAMRGIRQCPLGVGLELDVCPPQLMTLFTVERGETEDSKIILQLVPTRKSWELSRNDLI